jgi:biotin operon repressor
LSWCNDAEHNLIRILQGRKTALSGPELAAMLKTSDRQVRAMISHLRKDHHVPICSTPAEGFFYPWSRSAAGHTIAQLKSRIGELQAVIDGIEEGLEGEFGWPCQMEMEDVG